MDSDEFKVQFSNGLDHEFRILKLDKVMGKLRNKKQNAFIRIMEGYDAPLPSAD